MWSFTAAAVLFLVTIAITRLFRGPLNADIEAQQTIDEKWDLRQNEEPEASSKLPASIVDSTVARDTWVLRLTQHVCDERHRGRYNVLVINEELEYFFSPEDVVEEMNVEYHESKIKAGDPFKRTIKYRVIVFGSGSLVNLGDGGDINWDWKGNFDRTSAKTLAFKKCVAGTQYQQDPWQAVAPQ